MNVQGLARHARLLVTSTIDAVKEARKAGSINFVVQFQITGMAGNINDSETLSLLEKLESALKQLPGEMQMQFALNMPAVDQREEDLLKDIEGRYSRVMELEAPAAAPKTPIIGG